MRPPVLLLLAPVLWILLLPGCTMPARGTPVHVDLRAGSFWSGEGLLLEVDEAEQRCRVAVRDRALVVRKKWVDCRHVHSRSTLEGSASR